MGKGPILQMRNLRRRVAGVSLCFLTLLASCAPASRSPVGFRLPEDGDPERGRAAFVQLECHGCHSVREAQLPEPPAGRAVDVVLGGPVEGLMTDGYLVSGIIHPSHKLTRRVAKEEVSVEGKSRMPDYARGMTVRQLIDIVAFLQSNYTVAPQAYRRP